MSVLRAPLLSALFVVAAASMSAAAQQGDTAGTSANSSSAPTTSAEPHWQEGPYDLPLLDQAILRLPKGYGYLEGDEARQLMRQWGNPYVDDVIGLFAGPGGDWFVSVRFEKAGYIKDDEAKNWKADELLQTLKQGAQEINKRRREQGLPEMEVVDWVEQPHYDAATQRLIWAVSLKDKGSQAAEDQGINYNTYALGREGYFTLNLVTGLKQIAQNKLHASTLLSALEYREGKAYRDFNEDIDTVAEYGLTALIAGVAAKKLGLLALAGVFIAKFAKLIVLAVVGGLALIGRLFRKKKITVADAQQPGNHLKG
ncbi:DUF2167 domain-containing protein [Herbaspirillum sp. ST 5-3]|uniref:DUF2167 domain-containing protein n=1 Tax=Oxalobacteraceae TaxID=75682 RepID=UPI0010A38BEE|nr:DUF2167 domain-containing protein [Herbaspirillum sp. ST 5-3]